MSRHELTYTAASLEDIAKEFDRLADQAKANDKANISDWEAARATAFVQAAAILRATKLVTPAPIIPNPTPYYVNEEYKKRGHGTIKF